ncbi:type-F conjugative transfer system pilin assembly protein TrbC [Qipengyuania citrea]|uniref:type-F conjugative transfer system pilin assembly protein TrbC n=1 Tax=Qipengyuania citrea TaxID=225971 RepID=UPI0032985748
MRKTILTLGIIAVSAGFGAALAQTVDGLDLGAIQARADAQSQDAAVLSAEVARRAEEYREDTQTIQAVAMERVKGLDPQALAKGPTGTVDFDELVAAASGNLKDNRGTAPQFMVFVSLSMPEEALKRIIDETSAAGGFVVFRGFPNNSGKQFLAAISKVVDKEDQYASIGIDPRLFRAFDVQAVPTYVAVSSDFTPCDGLACKTTPPPFDAMSGNVTVSYALETFAGDNGPGALVARTALRNMGGAR